MGIRNVNVMCDLETLGVRPGSKILSIGAVVFGPQGLGPEFYVEVSRDFQGTLVEDPETVSWWSLQPSDVRDRLFNPDPRKPFLSSALFDFNEWLDGLTLTSADGPAEVAMWGNGATMDNSLLRFAYKSVNGPKDTAWPWWNDFCYRTLKNLRPDVKLERADTRSKHHALWDAQHQALHAIQLMKALQLWV